MTYDVLALGELLIDFTQYGESEQGNLTFEANPGGAPCNVLAMLQRLGRNTGFIGKVGADRFGAILREAIKEQGIDDAFLSASQEVPTTLALVHKLPNGDRDFSFYRSPGADMTLTEAEVPEAAFAAAKIFHFGTLSMTDEPVRAATKKAVAEAEKNGVLISFDPNLRPPLWRHEEDAKAAFDFGLRHCHILKISDNEITWFTGCDTVEAGLKKLRADYPNIRLLNASLGKDGSESFCGDAHTFVPAFLRNDTVDTTGAGDTFCACCLNAVLACGLEGLANEAALRDMLRFANAAASLVTTHKGALRVMPKRADVEAILNQNPA